MSISANFPLSRRGSYAAPVPGLVAALLLVWLMVLVAAGVRAQSAPAAPTLESLFPAPATRALAKAVLARDRGRMVALLRAGADPDASGQQGMTLTLWALARADLPGFQLLLAAGADPDRADDRGQRATVLAAGLADPRYLRLALEAGGDANGRGLRRATPLIAAAAGGHDGNVALLIGRGVFLDALDIEGDSALAVAALLDRPAIVQRLLAAGADPRSRNAEGLNALDYARAAGAGAVVRLLQDAPAPRYVTRVNTNLRAEPGRQGRRLATLPRGSAVEVVARSNAGDWVGIRRGDGSMGFLYAPLLKRLAGGG